MARKIKQLKDSDGKNFFPVTKFIAVLDEDGNPLYKTISDLKKQIAEGGGTDLSDYYTKEETDNLIPTKNSDLTNDSGYITSAVTSMTNYYSKTDLNNRLNDDIAETKTILLSSNWVADANNVMYESDGYSIPSELTVLYRGEYNNFLDTEKYLTSSFSIIANGTTYSPVADTSTTTGRWLYFITASATSSIRVFIKADRISVVNNTGTEQILTKISNNVACYKYTIANASISRHKIDVKIEDNSRDAAKEFEVWDTAFIGTGTLTLYANTLPTKNIYILYSGIKSNIAFNKADVSGVEMVSEDELAPELKGKIDGFQTESAVTASISAHNASEESHADIRNTITELEGIIAELKQEIIDLGSDIIGYIRTSGVSNPAFTFDNFVTTGRKNPMEVIAPCLVNEDGTINKVLNKLNWNKDVDGNDVALDGSMGNVLLVNTEPLYMINGKINYKGTICDCFCRSLRPFKIGDTEAEKVEPLGVAPNFCVAHRDSADNLMKMYSIYNPTYAGSYQAMRGIEGKFIINSDLTETYDSGGTYTSDGLGFPSTDISLYDGEQYAMNHNADTTAVYPYFNHSAFDAELWFGHMVTECGTFDVTTETLLGSGFSSMWFAKEATYWEESNGSPRNGARYIGSDGTEEFIDYGWRGSPSPFNTVTDGSVATMINGWRSPWKCLEQQRIVSYALANGIPELTWFEWEGNKVKYKSIEGFDSIEQGEMSAIVWKIFSTKFTSEAKDPNTGESIAGNRIDFMFSSAVYRGYVTDTSPGWWMSGNYYILHSDGTNDGYYQHDNLLLKKTTTVDGLNEGETFGFEDTYPMVCSGISSAGGSLKDYSKDCLMAPLDDATHTGGSSHSYICRYNWLGGTAPSTGRICLHGVRRGNAAYGSVLAPLSAYADLAPSHASSNVGFALHCVIVA